MVLVEVDPTSTSNIQDGRITKGNGSDIVWNAREKPRDVVWIETGE